MSDQKVDAKKNGVVDTSNWVDEQIGFAPYWNPEPNKSFIGRVVDRDDRDPDFMRYLMQAGQELDCRRGPVDSAEDVKVSIGEHFSISVYYALKDVFDFYLESGIRPLLKVTAVKEVKTKTAGQTCWTWRVQVSPKDKALLDQAREKARLLKERSDAEEFPPKQMNT